MKMRLMRKVKICGLAILLLCVLINVESVQASEKLYEDVEVTVISDVNDSNGEVLVTFEVRNVSSATIKNVRISDVSIEGYMLKNEQLNREMGNLRPNEYIIVSEDYVPNLTVDGINVDDGYNDEDNVVTVDAGRADYIPIIVIIMLCSLFAVMIFCKKNKKQCVSMIMCIVLLCGCVMPFMSYDVHASEVEQKECAFTETLFINNNSVDVEVLVAYDTIDWNKAVSVSYELGMEQDDIYNACYYKTLYLEKGEQIIKPENPISNMAFFEGWYTKTDGKEMFDFSKPVTENVIIYAHWETNVKDTDGDGVYDCFEEKNGTDLYNQDTDGDGIDDYTELCLSYNPLIFDTDGDGIFDKDEDLDEDMLVNCEEVLYGTKLDCSDSDYDGLSDYEEVKIYNTNPLKEDTDDDGTSDLWEVDNNYLPTEKNEIFDVTITSEAVTEYNLVSAQVDICLSGKQVQTLNVNAVTNSDNYLVRPTLPGYLGLAYDFTVDGSFEKATLTFCYNVDVYGEPDEEFQPRIYYVNEETQLYEELENQVVCDGKVVAETTHFSTYILLNKVEFDKVWMSDIQPPQIEDVDSETSIDVAFVIDYSSSMEDNDPNQLFKDVIKDFISKLRCEQDKVAVVKFVKRATIVSNLSSDFETVKKEIDNIEYNDGYTNYPGTDGSVGLKVGLDTLHKSEAKYKYIVFLTDGEDNSFKFPYEDVINRANEEGVIIYTIGLGNASEPVLMNVAEETGGKYYKAQSQNAVKLEECFGIIGMDTYGKLKDSNKDGITDYYSKLIYEGIMPGADMFEGVDFNKSKDIDGDGLKNGSEIVIVEEGDYVYAKMLSNPMLKHSDNDGISDGDEVENGSNPLKYSIYNGLVNVLLSEDCFMHTRAAERYKTDGLTKFTINSGAFMYAVDGRTEIYRDILVDYFSSYVVTEYLDIETYEATRKLMNDSLLEMLFDITNGTNDNIASKYLYIESIYGLMSEINGTTNTNDLYVIYEKYGMLVQQIEISYTDVNIPVKTTSLSQTTKSKLNLTKLGDSVNKICNGITIAVGVVDVLDTIKTFATIEANCVVFENSIDILECISNNSDDKYASSAAKDICSMLADEYGEAIKAVIDDLSENSIKYLAEALMSKNPYTTAVVIIRDGIDIVTGVSEDIEQAFSMYCYAELGQAVTELFLGVVDINDSFYEIVNCTFPKSIVMKKYLSHLINVRILGENMYVDWIKGEGIFDSEDNYSDAKEAADYIIEVVKAIATVHDIKISEKL